MEKNIMERQRIELLIIGAGPAGTAAGVYAARKKVETVLVSDSYGGQSVVSPDVKNWIGTPSISGHDLAESFKKHLKEYEGNSLTILESRVTSLQEKDGALVATCKNGSTLEAQAVLIASGADRRRITVPGADDFEHKGLTYCASCDGPLFTDKDVVVIGGGNAGFETAAQLLAYTKSVTLLHRNDTYKADAITVTKVLEHPNMTGITNANITSVFGDGLVKGITYEAHGEEKTLAVEGVFVEVGFIPSTGVVGDLAETDAIGRIVIDPRTQQTSHKKIWAAGDCCDNIFHQNNIAAGDAVKAIEHLYLALRTQ